MSLSPSMLHGFSFTVHVHSPPSCARLWTARMAFLIRGPRILGSTLSEIPKKVKTLKPKTLSFSDTQTGGPRTLTQPFVSVRGPPKPVSENEAENRFNEFAENSCSSAVFNCSVFLLPVDYQDLLVFNESSLEWDCAADRTIRCSTIIQTFPADRCGKTEISLHEEGARRAEEHPSSRRFL